MQVGQTFSQTISVSEQDTAVALGSGGLPVFGTPAMIAYMENTALKMVADALPEGSQTVGTEINAKHTKAALVGARITFTATITEIDGRRIAYSIEAKNEQGELIGSADHQRFVVDAERFMSKLK